MVKEQDAPDRVDSNGLVVGSIIEFDYFSDFAIDWAQKQDILGGSGTSKDAYILPTISRHLSYMY